jgi:hypothetical protein
MNGLCYDSIIHLWMLTRNERMHYCTALLRRNQKCKSNRRDDPNFNRLIFLARHIVSSAPLHTQHSSGFAAQSPAPSMSGGLIVVVFNEDDGEWMRDTMPPSSTVGSLKLKLAEAFGALDADARGDAALLSVNLHVKKKFSQDFQWSLLFSPDDCGLVHVRDSVAHRRDDGLLCVKAAFVPVWRMQAYIGLFADPYIVSLLHVFVLMRFLKFKLFVRRSWILRAVCCSRRCARLE